MHYQRHRFLLASVFSSVVDWVSGQCCFGKNRLRSTLGEHLPKHVGNIDYSLGDMITPGDKSERVRIMPAELAGIAKPTSEEYERARGAPRPGRALAELGWREIVLEMQALMQPGDELWEYCSDKQSWDQLMGLAGFELLRGGEVVKRRVWRMN